MRSKRQLEADRIQEPCVAVGALARDDLRREFADARGVLETVPAVPARLDYVWRARQPANDELIAREMGNPELGLSSVPAGGPGGVGAVCGSDGGCCCDHGYAGRIRSARSPPRSPSLPASSCSSRPRTRTRRQTPNELTASPTKQAGEVPRRRLVTLRRGQPTTMPTRNASAQRLMRRTYAHRVPASIYSKRAGSRNPASQ
jgi:hypothetical protein